MDCLKIEQGTSLVRVFHAAPQAPAVDVYVNDSLVFSNLEYMNFTDYVPLQAGEYKIDVYPAGTNETPVISQMVDVPEGEMITVAATGNLDDLSLLIIIDHVKQIPSDDFSTFRIVHLSPNAPAIDVLVDGQELINDIQFREGSSYANVYPGNYRIRVVLNSNKTTVLPLKVTLNGNRIYTIYIVGDSPDLAAIQSVDGNTYLCR